MRSVLSLLVYKWNVRAFVFVVVMISARAFAIGACSFLIIEQGSDTFPNNIIVLEKQLTELNIEGQRFDNHAENKELSESEMREVLSQEDIKYTAEHDVRSVYVARLRALRVKIVEKLTSMYLLHYQNELAGVNVDALRPILYSIILNTKIRSFDVESVKSIKQIARNISRLLQLKESVDVMRNKSFKIRNAIGEGDVAYVTEILSGLQIDYNIKIKKHNRKTIIAAADSAIADLNTIIETTVKEMDSLNLETIDLLSAFSGLAPSLNANGFQKWVNHDNDRSYFDELIALANSFLPDKDRVSDCCGRPCGLTCPYLTRMDIPIPNLDNLPSNPKLAVYRTFLVFREIVPDDVLLFPIRPSTLRKQLNKIKDMEP